MRARDAAERSHAIIVAALDDEDFKTVDDLATEMLTRQNERRAAAALRERNLVLAGLAELREAPAIVHRRGPVLFDSPAVPSVEYPSAHELGGEVAE